MVPWYVAHVFYEWFWNGIIITIIIMIIISVITVIVIAELRHTHYYNFVCFLNLTLFIN